MLKNINSSLYFELVSGVKGGSGLTGDRSGASWLSPPGPPREVSRSVTRRAGNEFTALPHHGEH